MLAVWTIAEDTLFLQHSSSWGSYHWWLHYHRSCFNNIFIRTSFLFLWLYLISRKFTVTATAKALMKQWFSFRVDGFTYNKVRWSLLILFSGLSYVSRCFPCPFHKWRHCITIVFWIAAHMQHTLQRHLSYTIIHLQPKHTKYYSKMPVDQMWPDWPEFQLYSKYPTSVVLSTQWKDFENMRSFRTMEFQIGLKTGWKLARIGQDWSIIHYI